MTLPQTFAGIVPGLSRHYAAGPRHLYAYTYANPQEVGPVQPMQLECWVPKGRKGGTWKLATTCHPDHARRTWRKVRPGHSHADKLAHSITMRDRAPWRTVEDQCDAYLAWARAKGLATVSVYAPDEKLASKGWYGAKCAKALGFELRAVDPADIHGDAPVDEYDCYGDWDNDGALNDE